MCVCNHCSSLRWLHVFKIQNLLSTIKKRVITLIIMDCLHTYFIFGYLQMILGAKDWNEKLHNLTFTSAGKRWGSAFGKCCTEPVRVKRTQPDGHWEGWASIYRSSPCLVGPTWLWGCSAGLRQQARDSPWPSHTGVQLFTLGCFFVYLTKAFGSSC